MLRKLRLKQKNGFLIYKKMCIHPTEHEKCLTANKNEQVRTRNLLYLFYCCVIIMYYYVKLYYTEFSRPYILPFLKKNSRPDD